MQRIITVLVLVLLLHSCEKSIKVNVPPQPARLVLHCVTALADSFRLSLSSSIGILQYTGQQISVHNGTLLLYDNEVIADTFIYDSARDLYLSDKVAAPGHTYRIQANAPGFEQAAATATVPPDVPMEVTVTGNARTGTDGFPMAEVRIRFRDPGGNDPDSYRIAITRPYGIDESYISGCIQVTDPSVEQLRDMDAMEKPCYTGGNMYLRDQLFNGKEKEVRLYISHADILPYVNPSDDTIRSVIGLEHYRENYFLYLKSKEYLWYNDGNPFAEPTNVQTNVKNGYGIFAITAVHKYTVR